MSIEDFAANALRSITIRSGKKLAKKGAAPEIPAQQPVRMKNGTDSSYNVGFSCAEVMPRDVTATRYWMAGYKMSNPVTGVYDPLTVSAMWIDCKDNGGIVMVSADIVGLTGYDVNTIRESMSDFTARTGCKSISISCTHTHAGIDTVGYWGRLFPPQTGKNKEYQQQLFAAIKKVCEEAYENRTQGKLYMGSVHVPDAISDGRPPFVVNDLLTRLRFVPDDGSTETWFLNYSAHPNTMGGDCTKVSADYPYHLRERIYEDKKVNVLFSVGAIAAVNIADLAEDRLERTRLGGRMLGEAALNIDNDEQLDAEITVVVQPYYAPVENYVLYFMAATSFCTGLKYPGTESSLGVALKSEMTYLKLGKQKFLMLPGEAFTEFVYGGYASAEESATGKGPEINPTPLAEIANDQNLIIYGVTNDMTGYMVPPNDCVLHPTQAYLSSTHDKFDRNHYHETNSLSDKITHVIAKTFKEIIDRTEK